MPQLVVNATFLDFIIAKPGRVSPTHIRGAGGLLGPKARVHMSAAVFCWVSISAVTAYNWASILQMVL